jgi:tRNA A22 N-methylase
MGRRNRRRLEALAALTPRVRRAADIGAGDLELARLLLARGRAESVVAVERAEGAWRRAVERARGDGRLEVRRGDGLDPLRAGEAGVAVLAGLGGTAIARIVQRAAVRRPAVLPPFLVIGPTSQPEAAVAAARAAGYAPERATVVPEGRHLRCLLRLVREGGEPAVGVERDGARLFRPEDDMGVRVAYAQERLALLRRELGRVGGQRADVLKAWIDQLEGWL